jgi:hypothetical protein
VRLLHAIDLQGSLQLCRLNSDTCLCTGCVSLPPTALALRPHRTLGSASLNSLQGFTSEQQTDAKNTREGKHHSQDVAPSAAFKLPDDTQVCPPWRCSEPAQLWRALRRRLSHEGWQQRPQRSLHDLHLRPKRLQSGTQRNALGVALPDRPLPFVTQPPFGRVLAQLRVQQQLPGLPRGCSSARRQGRGRADSAGRVRALGRKGGERCSAGALVASLSWSPKQSPRFTDHINCYRHQSGGSPRGSCRASACRSSSRPAAPPPPPPRGGAGPSLSHTVRQKRCALLGSTLCSMCWLLKSTRRSCSGSTSNGGCAGAVAHT